MFELIVSDLFGLGIIVLVLKLSNLLQCRAQNCKFVQQFRQV